MGTLSTPLWPRRQTWIHNWRACATSSVGDSSATDRIEGNERGPGQGKML